MSEAKLLVCNWKMYLDSIDAIEKICEVCKPYESAKDIQVVMAPPYPYISSLKERGCSLVAGQDVSEHESGAYTSKVSAKMLKSLGCTHVIIGHSECRNEEQNIDFANKIMERKISQSLESGLKVIFCVGEPESEHHSAKNFIYKQLRALKSFIPNNNIIIAYEPIWAIGSGITPKPEQIADMCDNIKSVTVGNPVLYGGSISPNNIEQIKEINCLDGWLIGSASTKPSEMASILLAVSDI